MEATNPYAPPETALVFDAPPVETDEDHEAVRREHLAAESTLKVIAWLSFLQSIEAGAFFVLYMAGWALRDPEDMPGILGFAVGGLLGLAAGGVSAWRNTRELLELNPHQRRKHTLGLGLGTLAWIAVPLLFPALARFFLNSPLILGLIVGSLLVSTPLKLYAFWSRKASVVFSEHYRDVVVRWTSRKLRPGVSALGWALIALALSRMAGEVLLVLSVLARWKP